MKLNIDQAITLARQAVAAGVISDFYLDLDGSDEYIVAVVKPATNEGPALEFVFFHPSR